MSLPDLRPHNSQPSTRKMSDLYSAVFGYCLEVRLTKLFHGFELRQIRVRHALPSTARMVPMWNAVL